MRYSRDTPSARVEPRAAPLMPIGSSPSFPNISTQLKAMFEITITTELILRILVCVLPT